MSMYALRMIPCLLLLLGLSGFSADPYFLTSAVSPGSSLSKDSVIKRENLNGNDVVPVINFPGITQNDFTEAFNVLDECLVMEEPRFGFSYPFIAPGGHYGGCWWQLDGSLALYGTKWVNQSFSENMLRGFMAVQKPDGRIPLYGHDQVPGYPTCSSLPKLFLAAETVLKQSKDKELIKATYVCLKRYLDWWFSDIRRDRETGLITGVFEESFPPVEKELKAVAQVDLNVEVTAGCQYVAYLAGQLGHHADDAKYTALAKSLKKSINKYMWDENTGAYYAYLIKEKRLDDKLISYTFDPFRLHIAPPERVNKMIDMLTDDKYFNWAGNAITSAAKTDKTYNETMGDYNGAPAWSGDIWSLRNVSVITGLQDIGRYDLASALALKTVNLFNANYTEFLKPSDGSGHGVKRYAWSAAQYIQILIENIFGIDYNEFTGMLTIKPNLDESLTGRNISIEKLLLPTGNQLDLYISMQPDTVRIKYSLTGENKDMNVLIALPSNAKTGFKLANKVKLEKIKQQSATIYQVFKGKDYSDELRFIMIRN